MATASAVGTGMMVGSSLMSAAGALKQGNAAKAAYGAQAASKEQQAANVLKRNKFNNQQLSEEAWNYQQKQVGTMAASGIDVGTGASLMALADTESRLHEQIEINNIEAEFQANQLMLAAQADRKAGREYQKASRWSAAGSLLSGVGFALK